MALMQTGLPMQPRTTATAGGKEGPLLLVWDLPSTATCLRLTRRSSLAVPNGLYSAFKFNRKWGNMKWRKMKWTTGGSEVMLRCFHDKIGVRRHYIWIINSSTWFVLCNLYGIDESGKFWSVAVPLLSRDSRICCAIEDGDWLREWQWIGFV